MEQVFAGAPGSVEGLKFWVEPTVITFFAVAGLSTVSLPPAPLFPAATTMVIA
jgi:hypothetical protein